MSNIVVLVNKGMKYKINLGSQINHKFVQILHNVFRLKLKDICDRYELNYNTKISLNNPI